MATKAIVTGGTPVLLAPGAEGGGGGDIVFGADVPAAVFKTLNDNLLVGPLGSGNLSSAADVVTGMAEFVALALADDVAGREVASRDEIVAASSFNVQNPPASRQAIVLRQFDFRPALSSLADDVKSNIQVLTAMSDQVIQSKTTAEYYDELGLPQKRINGEGHALFAREPDLFNSEIMKFVG